MTPRSITSLVLSTAIWLVAADSCAAAPQRGGPPLRDRVAAYELTVLVDGSPARTYAHRGGTFLLGELGARYTLRVSNHSGRRVEAVLSVDGRDVIDGRPADFRSKRGYLIPAWGSVDIDGWRISHAEAAAFRFASVRDSYAARTGSARDVGVIGVAVFPERYVAPAPLVRPYGYRHHGLPTPPSAGAPQDFGRAEDSAGRSARKAPSAAEMPQSSAAPESRPGLGTEYGEAVSSPIYEVDFVRAHSSQPAAILGVRYNDRAGLLAIGLPIDQYDSGYPCAYDETDLRATAEPFPVTDRRFAPPPAGWRRTCGWR